MSATRLSASTLATSFGLLLTVASGCGDGFGPGARGSLSFDYSGAREGRFAVAADTPSVSVEGVPEFGDWTLAAAGDSLGGVVVSGFRVADGTGDLFVLQLDQLRAGAFACGPSSACHGRVLFGIFDHGGLPPHPAPAHYEIVDGEVVLSLATTDRLQGSFSFTARDQGGTGPNELGVTDGSFDLRPASQAAGGSVVCFGQRASGSECS